MRRRACRGADVADLRALGGDGDRWLVKLFSEQRLGDDELDTLFGLDHVHDVTRVEWDACAFVHDPPFAYDCADPTMPPIADDQYAPLKLDDGLYYANIEVRSPGAVPDA